VPPQRYCTYAVRLPAGSSRAAARQTQQHPPGGGRKEQMGVLRVDEAAVSGTM
jgi:hypothetical protein